MASTQDGERRHVANVTSPSVGSGTAAPKGTWPPNGDGGAARSILLRRVQACGEKRWEHRVGESTQSKNDELSSR